jgi:hypothetical protein
VKQLVGKTGVFLHCIVQAIWAICFKKPVESLNSCQTIPGQKRLIFPYYYTGIEQTIFQKINWGSKQFATHLTARIKKFAWHLTDNKSAKIYANCRHFTLFLLHKCLLLKCKNKSKKAWKFPANCLYNRQTFYWQIPSEQKCLYRPIADSNLWPS